MKKIVTSRTFHFIVSSALIVLLLSTTSPKTIGPQGITVFFLLFYLWSLTGVKLALAFLSRGIRRMPIEPSDFLPTAVLAGVPTLILALQSTGQLAWWDALLILVVVLVIIFYWKRRKI